MKRIFCSRVFLFFTMITFLPSVRAVNIGSDTTVDRFAAQQTLNNGDVVASFAFLEGGFSLASAATQATFRSTFPVAGTVEIDAGTLIFEHDFIFMNNAIFSSFGDIVGNGHALFLAPSMVLLPAVAPAQVNCFRWSDIKVILGCDVMLENCCIIFDGVSSVIGQGHCLTLAPTCTLQVDVDATLLLKDIIIDGINTNKIECLDDLSTISFDNVRWIQDGNYNFSAGRFDVIRNWQLEGDGYQFNYQTNQQSTIAECGVMEIASDFIFSYEPSIARLDLLDLAFETSQLILSGATLHVSSTGLVLTKGILTVDDKSQFVSDATVKAEGIHLGDGISKSNNVAVGWLAESGFELASGFLVYNNV